MKPFSRNKVLSLIAAVAILTSVSGVSAFASTLPNQQSGCTSQGNCFSSILGAGSSLANLSTAFTLYAPLSTVYAPVGHSVALPSEVSVLRADGITVDTPVIWKTSTVNWKTVGTYTVNGVMPQNSNTTITCTVDVVASTVARVTSQTVSVGLNADIFLPSKTQDMGSNGKTINKAVTWSGPLAISATGEVTLNTTNTVINLTGGVQAVTFTGTVAGSTNTLSFTMLVNPVPVSANSGSATVTTGSKFTAPTSLSVVYSDGVTRIFNARWQGDVNTNKPGVYVLKTLIPFAGATSTAYDTVTYTVTVTASGTFATPTVTATKIVSSLTTITTPPTPPVTVEGISTTNTAEDLSVVWGSPVITTGTGFSLYTYTGTVAGVTGTVTYSVKLVTLNPVTNITITAKSGVIVNLPCTETIGLSDGTTATERVCWKGTPNLSRITAPKTGTETVTGQVVGTSATVVLTIKVQ
jgi:hypothetical protein